MDNGPKEKKGLNISAKSFITAILVIFALMVATYIMTLVIPGGEYARITDASGNTVIDTSQGFHNVEGGIPFIKWLFSPVLVLFAPGSGSLIAVMIFLLVIGGVFNSLEKARLMRYMLDVITDRFASRKYILLAVVVLFFMSLGALIGSFEECIPLVPIVVALAVCLGWDALTGVGMSLLAIGCGFATGVMNPFTVGVAQELAGLPMFSGAGFRLVIFVIIYAVLLGFLYRYAKKIDNPSAVTFSRGENTGDRRMRRGLICFFAILGTGIIFLLLSAVIPALQDYTMIIVAVMFLLAGISATLLSGMKVKRLAVTFFNGVVSVLPGILMILMANSVKYTLEEARILDTILHAAVSAAENIPRWSVILFIYLIVLVMNLFIPSGSAKAFLLIPLIVPVAQLFGISPQLAIVAFAFGDGFSNVIYPTNPVLLISLGLADLNYGKWAKWSAPFQCLILILTSVILLAGLAIY